MLEDFLLGSGRNCHNQHRKNKENTTLKRSNILSMSGDVPKIHHSIFFRSQSCGQYEKVYIERML